MMYVIFLLIDREKFRMWLIVYISLCAYAIISLTNVYSQSAHMYQYQSFMYDTQPLWYKSSLRGKIIDKSQNPLPNIKVTIIELGITTYTNEQGEYAFCSFVEGTYTVLFDDGKTQRLLQNLSMPKRVIYNMEW